MSASSLAEEEVYHPPAFPFYGERFLAATSDIPTEEVGAYMLLICKAWELGGIPDDLRKIANIVRLPVPRARLAWRDLERFFSPHPNRPDWLIQKRLETIRREMFERSLIASEKGKRGAAARYGRGNASAIAGAVAGGVANGVADGQLEVSIPSSKLQDSIISSSLRSEAPEWAENVKMATRALLDRPISSLPPDERFTVAQYHCLEFANCTRSENRNRAQATKVAGSFATMGRNDRYKDITVREYVAYARKVHERREKKPWFEPWLIRGEVEFT